jgi:hypothetical protein
MSKFKVGDLAEILHSHEYIPYVVANSIVEVVSVEGTDIAVNINGKFIVFHTDELGLVVNGDLKMSKKFKVGDKVYIAESFKAIKVMTGTKGEVINDLNNETYLVKFTNPPTSNNISMVFHGDYLKMDESIKCPIVHPKQSKFEVGDLAWSPSCGLITLKNSGRTDNYTVTDGVESYDRHGNLNLMDKHPTLLTIEEALRLGRITPFMVDEASKAPAAKNKVKIELWTNIYSEDMVFSYKTKAEADRSQMNGRIACVKLTGEYEV